MNKDIAQEEPRRRPLLIDKLRQIKDRQGISEGVIAHMAKIKPSWLSRIKSGHESPSEPQAERLTRVINKRLHENVTTEKLLAPVEYMGVKVEQEVAE